MTERPRPAARKRTLCIGLTLCAVVAGLYGGSLLRLGDPGLPADTVVVIDGVPFTRGALEAHLGSREPFVSFPAAQRAVQAFAEHVVFRSEAARRGMPDGAHDALVAELISEWGVVSEVTRADVERYYEEHRERFVRPRKVRAVYFRVDPSGDPEQDSRRIAALYIRAQLARSPAAFGSLLDEAAEGVAAGELAPFSCAEVHPVLPDAVVRQVCALPAGGLSGPMKTERGHFLVRKLADYPARHVTLARAQREIRIELESRARNVVIDDVRSQLLDAADIEIPTGALVPLVKLPTEPEDSGGPPRAPGWS